MGRAMRRQWRRARRTVTRRVWHVVSAQPEAAEIYSGLYALMLGGWLMWPVNTFHSAGAYAGLARLAERLGATGHGAEVLWGGLMVLIGVAQIAALPWPTGPRQTVAIVAAAWWGWVALEFFRANPVSLGIPAYLLMALVNLWLIGRLGVMRDTREPRHDAP